MKKVINVVLLIGLFIILIRMKPYKASFNEVDKQNKLNDYSSIIEHAINEVRLTSNIIVEDKMPLGVSKLGGRPDLPADVTWPVFNNKPLSFLAQLNLEELCNVYDHTDMPKTGMLYFFYDNAQETWGMSIEEKSSWRVIYSESDDHLVRTAFPKNLMDDYRFGSAKVDMMLRQSYPQWENDIVQLANLTDEATDHYIDFVGDSYGENGVITKVFGYPNQIQGNMDVECQMIADGITYEDIRKYSSAKRSELNNRAKDWTLLFQLDSEESIHMIWGDVGRLYFWINKEDLKNRNFDDVWMILQCY